MDQPNPTNLFNEFTKMMQQVQLPGLDVQAIVEARRKDIEALTEANRIAFQGMQSLAQKQTEILRTTLDQLRSLMQQMSSQTPMENAAKSSELVQQGLQRAFDNMRQLAEAAARSQTDAFNVVNQRVQQNIEELRTMLQTKK